MQSLKRLQSYSYVSRNDDKEPRKQYWFETAK